MEEPVLLFSTQMYNMRELPDDTQVTSELNYGVFVFE